MSSKRKPLSLALSFKSLCMADPMPHPTTLHVLAFQSDTHTKKAENVFRGKYQAGANSIKGQVLHLNRKPRKIFFSDLSLCFRINLSPSLIPTSFRRKSQYTFFLLSDFYSRRSVVRNGQRNEKKGSDFCRLWQHTLVSLMS